MLEVCDEGEGIPKADRESAKAPFVRLKEEGSGTGLGLHLVAQTALCTAPSWTCATSILWVSRFVWFGLRGVESAPTFAA